MVTFNILSVPRFKEFLVEIKELKEQFPELILDLSYLREPEYLRANLLGESWTETMKESLIYLKENDDFFSDHEINKVDRIYQWMKTPMDSQQKQWAKKMKADFYVFVNEYDRRYQKVFLNIFPELRDFYINCKKEKFLASFE